MKKILSSSNLQKIVFILVISFILNIQFASIQNIKASTGGLNYTIDQTFPDDKMAALVANKIAGGDINHVIVQSDIDNSKVWNDLGFEFISDITGIEHFVNLEDLQLPFNNVTFLPDGFSNLTKLKYLDLSSNLLTELPSDFGNLTSLTNLWIDENQITALPDSFSMLSNLERLEATVNKLTTLPNNFDNLDKLKVLMLTYNEITTLPTNFGNLDSIEVIRLNDNFLTEIPSSIENATNLKILWVNNNNLTTLPNTIVNLNNLENLAIGANKIVSLPNDIEKLSSLIYLSFENNQLTSLPANFKQLPALTTLRLYNNLLPSNIVDDLAQFTINSSTIGQDKLKLTNSTLSYTIKQESDLTNINYKDYLALANNRELSNQHKYIFDDIRNENNDTTTLDQYIKNGVVIKSGKVLVKIRATGIGLYPNSSDNALTAGTIELIFVKQSIIYYTLSFDLNGGTSPKITPQILQYNQLATKPNNPTKDNNTFLGWNTKKDGSGTYWKFDVDKMPSKDVVLYAQWKEKEKLIPITGDSTVVNVITVLVLSSLSLIGYVYRKSIS